MLTTATKSFKISGFLPQDTMHGMHACGCLWMHVDALLIHVDACMLVEESVACMHACHAWYLVEESVILSLFSSASNKAKRVIADKLR